MKTSNLIKTLRLAQEAVQEAKTQQGNQQQPQEESSKDSDPSKEQFYKIVAGDTLSEIAEKFYGSSDLWPIIATANNISPQETYRLQIGRELVIPIKRSLSGDEVNTNKRFYPDLNTHKSLLQNPSQIESYVKDLELTDLSKVQGISIKSGVGQYAHPKIEEALKDLISKNIPVRITEAFPSTGMHSSATHRNGGAVDFTIGPPGNPNAAKVAPQVVQYLKSKGFKVINEYAVDTKYKTGEHIHLSV
jgi:LysM repeat protein